jgi:hypothetical protein
VTPFRCAGPSEGFVDRVLGIFAASRDETHGRDELGVSTRVEVLERPGIHMTSCTDDDAHGMREVDKNFR